MSENPNNFDLLGNRAFAYMHSGRPREWLNDLTAAAEGGSANAQSELGRMYMCGISDVLTPDFNSGLASFRKSAAQGYEAGCQNLERALALLPRRNCNPKINVISFQRRQLSRARVLM